MAVMEGVVADNKDNSSAGMARQAFTRVVRFIDANHKVNIVILFNHLYSFF